MEHRQRRVFPESFKREAVDRVASSGLSAGRGAAPSTNLRPAPKTRHSTTEPNRRLRCRERTTPPTSAPGTGR